MRRTLSVKIRILLVALVISLCAFGQEPARIIHGTWIATIGKTRVLHGRWAGGTLPHRPNLAEGTWTLDVTGQVTLHGTWKAEKSDRGWQGIWSGRTAQGESLAGSWGTGFEHWHGRTLEDMLERTLVVQVSGWWQAGHMQGDWWLKGSS